MKTKLQCIGKYELIEPLGSGATAEAWKAFDTQAKRFVVLKILHDHLCTDREYVSRLFREAQYLARLHHPNIVEVYDVQIIPHSSELSAPFIVMEYIQGPTLAEVMAFTSEQGWAWSSHDLLHFFITIGAAIDYAHAAGVLHRDIKPSNILLKQCDTSRNSLGEPFLADFGIAKIMGTPSGSLTNGFIGTALYVAPEQVRGYASTPSSDLYSLGVILYELCTGYPPFQGENLSEVLFKHLHASPPLPRQLNPALPVPLEQVILRSLAKDPAARYSSATELARALAAALKLSAFPVVFTPATCAPENLPLISHHAPVGKSSFPTDIVCSSAPQPSASMETTFIKHQQYIRSFRIEAKTPYKSPISVASASLQSGVHRSFSYKEAAVFPSSGSSKRQHIVWSRKRLMIVLLLLVFLITTVGFTLWQRPFAQRVTAVLPPVVGHAFFTSSEQINNGNGQGGMIDTVQLALNGVVSPSFDKRYYAWLRNTSSNEAKTILLGALMLENGKATLSRPYIDPQHRNLLADGNGILITEEPSQTLPLGPSLDHSMWHYSAEFSLQPGIDGLSLFQHIQHLLYRDPTLYQQTGLDGGLSALFLNNTERVWQIAADLQSQSDPQLLRQDSDDLLSYLHGSVCGKLDMQQQSVNSIQVAQSPTIMREARVPLVNCLQTALEPYPQHILFHVNGFINAPGVTASQKALAGQIVPSLERVNALLTELLADVQQLMTLSDAQLSAALALRNEVKQLAENAFTGWIDPASGGEQAGVKAICNLIERFATLDIHPLPSK